MSPTSHVEPEAKTLRSSPILRLEMQNLGSGTAKVVLTLELVKELATSLQPVMALSPW